MLEPQQKKIIPKPKVPAAKKPTQKPGQKGVQAKKPTPQKTAVKAKAAVPSGTKNISTQAFKPQAQAAKPSVSAPKPAQAPKAIWGITGFFKKELSALVKQGSQRLQNISAQAQKLVANAKTFAKNPGKAVAAGVTGAAGAIWKKATGVGQYAKQKVNQFKKWYATPEGKAKFWKGVALTAVGVATVASGGALTAPALALAAGISAAGGVAAKVVENKVYNSAAKAKAQKDKTYKYKARSTFEGVSAKSIAVDAVVGSVGGPIFKYAGKAVVGTVAALGKGVMPALRGTGQLGAGVVKGTMRKVLPKFAKNALNAGQKLIKKYAVDPAAKFSKNLLHGGKNLVNGAGKLTKAAKDKLLKVTAKPRAIMARQTKTLREFAKNAPSKVADYAKKKIATFRRFDRRLLTRLKIQVRKSPAVKLAKKIRDGVDGVGNKISKKLVTGKVRAADALDTMKANMGEKISQASLTKHARNLKDATTKRLDDIVARNPDGNFSKAILEYRASGTAIRSHLNKVWGEASRGMNKDLSRLLGRYGSVQADFKNLAEKGSKELYETEIAAARAAATDRLRTKVMHDAENAELLKLQKRGQAITETARQNARQSAELTANDAVSKSSEQLTRQAETFVARHPTSVLEQAALKVQALDAHKKVAEHYFGKNAGQKGLLERSGMAITTPFRLPLNERLEKYEKIVNAVRSSSPFSSLAVLGAETVGEQTEKAVRAGVEAPVKDWANALKGEPGKSKKAGAEHSSVILNIWDKSWEDSFPNFDPVEIEPDIQKQLNMADDK